MTRDSKVASDETFWQKGLIHLYGLYSSIPGLKRSWFDRRLFLPSYFLYKRIFEDSLLPVLTRYPQLLSEGHALDVGACFGYSAVTFSRFLPSSYKVFAFEPHPDNQIRLRASLRRYHLESKVEIIPKAVGNSDGNTPFWHNPRHPADHRVATTTLSQSLSREEKVIEVPICKLDTFARQRDLLSSISFIKIDVQGFELAVCQGMGECLAANPYASIFLEYSPAAQQSLGFASDALLDLFLTKGYKIYIYKKNKLEPLNSKEKAISTTKMQKYCDILFTKKSLTDS